MQKFVLLCEMHIKSRLGGMYRRTVFEVIKYMTETCPRRNAVHVPTALKNGKQTRQRTAVITLTSELTSVSIKIQQP